MQASDPRKEFANILRDKLKISDEKFHNVYQAKEKNPYAERVTAPHDLYRNQNPMEMGNLRRLDIRI